MADVKTIRGGWSHVPEGWHTKTQLNRMGLKPTGAPVGEVYSGRAWRMLYDIKETKEKRKPSEKQLAALEKARVKREEYEEQRRRAEYENQVNAHLERQRVVGMNTFGAWFERDFVILDTETTSLDGEIIDIAIIDREGKVLFNSLVKPKTSVTPGAYNVHRISDDMLATAPTWPEIYPKIKEMLKDRLVLIYNDEFDIERIWTTCTLWDLEPPFQLQTRCVMRDYAYYWGSRWVSLAEASGDWVEHRALGDCFSTLKVVKAMWQELGLIQSNESLASSQK